MQTKVKNLKGTSRLISIEISEDELSREFDQVYTDIGKVARIPGFRPGKVPRDLLKSHYEKKAVDEVIKRTIPEYYLRAVRQEQLAPVTPPEIVNVQFKKNRLCFDAKVDVRPKLNIKGYKNLKVVKKKPKVEQSQIDQALERLRQDKTRAAEAGSKAEKQDVQPELNDAFAKEFGFATMEQLKAAISQNLQAHAHSEVMRDIERQLMEQLLERSQLDVPQSLVENQKRELLQQMKLNRVLQGEKKEDVESKVKQLEDQAVKEATRRIKLSFILDEIAQRENIQVSEEELNKRIEAIAQQTGKSEVQVNQYLQKNNLTPSLKGELRDKKTIQFLLKEAKTTEEK